MSHLISFCLKNKLVVFLAMLFLIAWGVAVAPFDWRIDWLPRDPVPVDAIPDIGENQQIVFTEWMGRSPQDIEDQISYPLTVSMLGIPGVKTVRSYSMFGFSTIYIIFKEDVDFYWSRSRVLEKLNSLSAGSLPDGVQPALGPDATALGQIFWYTLEGHDPDTVSQDNPYGDPVGGWDLNELRSLQDWFVRYALLAAEGISEVASVGGFVQEYQVDVDPDAMRAHGVTLDEVFNAVKMSNVDVGARTVEVNNVEYVIRGLGFIKSIDDIRLSVVKVNDNVPLYVKDVAAVTLGPALRRGALDKGGAEVVGGVAVVRYGENPLAAIRNVKQKIADISPGLPSRLVIDNSRVTPEQVLATARKNGFAAYDADGMLNQGAWRHWLDNLPADQRPDWLRTSKITIVPFYDRTGLIYETLGTLNTALTEEILVTIIVIIVMVMHLRSSLVISGTLPLAVLICFIAMKLFGVDANIVALSGIAIAIGTIVDMGVIVCENILRHLDEAREARRLEEAADPTAAEPCLDAETTFAIVHRATTEVGGAVVTAIATTIISFLPVFTMIGAEGKLFKPLAFTKTFALLASVIVALTIVPALAHLLFPRRLPTGRVRVVVLVLTFAVGGAVAFPLAWWLGLIIMATALYLLLSPLLPQRMAAWTAKLANYALVLLVGIILTAHWEPLGPGAGFIANFIMVSLPIAGLLAFFLLFQRVYAPLLRLCLRFKPLFLSVPAVIVIIGMAVWLGWHPLFGWMPKSVRGTAVYESFNRAFPGLGKEFMPNLDEGSFLFMPTTMPHASIGEALDVLQKQDMAFSAIPEIETAVGKLGRAETPLDPAPISMIETVINYRPEYLADQAGHRRQFRFDPDTQDFFRDASGEPVPAPDGEPYIVQGMFVRDENGALLPDPHGRPFRNWRTALDPELNPGRDPWPGIQSPDDIWDAILAAGDIPGTTSAPKLQPIAARIVMLQSGMRAPMGIKIKGPDLDTIEAFGLRLERLLKDVPGVKAEAVIADRIVGKPYIEIDIDREAAARYGVPIRKVQDVIEIAVGGRRITTTVEGRERYPVRIRYMRELRDSIESLGQILVPGAGGQQVPMNQLAKIEYIRGPQVIKSEDTFLTGYVLFDKRDGFAEVDVVEACQTYFQASIESGELVVPPGVTYEFAGSYENQIRAAKTLSIVLPFALFLIFMILYFQFKSVPTTMLVFSGIVVAWAGGFILIWLYGQDWFLNVSVFGTNLRDLFQIGPINLSVAIWVGFLALFGVASDNGVVIATYLDQSFAQHPTDTIAGIREATVHAAVRRIRPCLMTSATTILALIPVLTSTGRGADIMVPMAIPSFGGMLVVLVSVFVVPVLYCSIQEHKLRFTPETAAPSDN
jgi:Cu(I)/Ag(I) efflux system membrane protein CusA/SilA